MYLLRHPLFEADDGAFLKNVRIIGLGSPHGDDTFGWVVVDLLQRQIVPESVELVVLDRPGAALLSYLQDVDHVWVIDAADMGEVPGTLHQMDAVQLLREPRLASITSHGIGLIETLQLADACQITLPPIHVFLVQLAHLESDQPLSPPVQLSAETLAADIRDLFTSD